MELENIKVIGVITVDNKVNLMLAVKDSTDWWSAEVLKDKKGSYIKLSNKYVDIAKTTTRKKYYIKDELWLAVNRFEKYLEKENGCAPAQPK